MSRKTGIGWCDSTANAVIGCTKVSPGCGACYAENDTPARVLRHRGVETWGLKGARVPVKSFEKNMLAMNKLPWICDECGDAGTLAPGEDPGMCACVVDEVGSQCGSIKYHRRRVFADSNSDWLDERWPVEILARSLAVIKGCDDLNILLLTKRAENFEDRLSKAQDWHFDNGDRDVCGWIQDWRKHGIAPKNVWIGVSVEDQKRADERIPLLLKIPAKIRFLSVEPLLEQVNLGLSKINYDAMCHGPAAKDPAIQWVIVGAESGGKRRDCGVEALCDAARQGVNAGCLVFTKQDCAFKPGQQGRIPDDIWNLKQIPC